MDTINHSPEHVSAPSDQGSGDTQRLTQSDPVPSTGDLRASAKGFAKRGFKVFPLHGIDGSGRCTCGKPECNDIEKTKGGKPKAGKHPRTLHGFKEATSDTAQIDEWWQKWPDANIGIATGADSGIFALDVDDGKIGEDSLKDLEAKNGELPETPCVATGGGGYHIYFKHPGVKVSNSVKKLGEGLDVRGDGGYVVAPPSRYISGKSYEWHQKFSIESASIADAPEWLLGLIQKPDQDETPETSSEELTKLRLRCPTDPELIGHVHAQLLKHRPAIEGEGGDAHTIAAATIVRKHFALTFDEAWPLAVEWNKACVPPWSEEELRAKFNRESYGPGECGKARSDFHFGQMLRKITEDQSSTASVQPSAPSGTWEGELQRARKDLAGSLDAKSDTEAKRQPFAPAIKLLTEDLPQTPWLVGGLIAADGVVVVGGEPKTTKTWTALEIGLSVATSHNAFGEFNVSGPPRQVALFLAEDSKQATRNRLRALVAGHNLEPAFALRNLHVLCRGNLNLIEDEQLARLIAECRMLKEAPALPILDPLRDLHREEENDSTAMAAVMHRLRALRDLIGCAIVFVHHVGKAGKENDSRRSGQRLRGSSAIHGAVDGGLYLQDLRGDGQNEWTSTVHVETKAARGAGIFSLTLNVEDDENGEAKVARWTFHKKGDEKPNAAIDTKMEQVRQFLRQKWRENPILSLSEDYIRQHVKGSADSIRTSLKQGEASHWALRATNGKKLTGWTYCPSSTERDENPAVIANSAAT